MATKPTNSDYKDLLIGMTELKTLVQSLKEDVQAIKDDFKGRLDDHEQRIRSLEIKWWIQVGAAGAVGAIIVQLVNLVSGTVHLTH